MKYEVSWFVQNDNGVSEPVVFTVEAASEFEALFLAGSRCPVPRSRHGFTCKPVASQQFDAEVMHQLRDSVERILTHYALRDRLDELTINVSSETYRLARLTGLTTFNGVSVRHPADNASTLPLGRASIFDETHLTLYNDDAGV